MHKRNRFNRIKRKKRKESLKHACGHILMFQDKRSLNVALNNHRKKLTKTKIITMQKDRIVKKKNQRMRRTKKKSVLRKKRKYPSKYRTQEVRFLNNHLTLIQKHITLSCISLSLEQSPKI